MSGSVIFEKEEYVLTKQANAENYKNTVRYYANAIKGDKTYTVAWELSDKYVENDEIYKKLKVKDWDDLTQEQADNLSYLEQYFGDETDACDWDNPIEVIEN